MLITLDSVGSGVMSSLEWKETGGHGESPRVRTGDHRAYYILSGEILNTGRSGDQLVASDCVIRTLSTSCVVALCN